LHRDRGKVLRKPLSALPHAQVDVREFKEKV
jgi:hypothetical protein